MKNHRGKFFKSFNNRIYFLICMLLLCIHVYYRIQLLELELASKKEVDHEETIHLEKAMEQVEDNLKRSTVSIRLFFIFNQCS